MIVAPEEKRPVNACTAHAGIDRCELEAGHDGDHRTHWTRLIVMTWRGDEEWART